MTLYDCETIIVGAGLAGLSCAQNLSQAGSQVCLLEASEGAGGRVRTDIVDGFLLDRGFQILLTAYPEAKRQLNYKQLDLHTLDPGALVRHAGKFHRLADPFRRPLQAFLSLFDATIPFSDKLRMGALQVAAARAFSADSEPADDPTSTAYLSEFGFSSAAIERFFRPFFGGVFLESELRTSSRWLRYLFHLFAAGQAAIPGQGMQAIPNQIASQLPKGSLRINTRVTRYELLTQAEGVSVMLESGERLTARHLVLATEECEARRILQRSGYARLLTTMRARQWNRTTTFYYAATHAPVDEPVLMLNGEGAKAGPVNNAVVISSACPNYAPAGAHLISASVVGYAPQDEAGRESLQQEVRRHLKQWFGQVVASWKLVGTYCLPHAVPLQQSFTPIVTQGGSVPISRNGGIQLLRQEHEPVSLCGDYCQSASIQGALLSGRTAAERLCGGSKTDSSQSRYAPTATS